MQPQQLTEADNLPQDIISIDRVLSNKGNGQGKVFLVQHKYMPYAAKIFAKRSDFKKQATILNRIKQFQNVTKLVYHNQNASIVREGGIVDIRPVIIMQLAQNGDLCDYLQKSSEYYKQQNRVYTIPIPIAKTILYQILTALQKVHEIGIIYRDLKYQNIIFDSEFKAILADYGFCYEQNVQGQSINCGTEGFKAPEVQSSQSISPASDVFVCGKIFYLICFYYQAFKSINDEHYKQFNRKNNEKILQRKWKSIQHKRAIVIPEEVKQLFCNIFKEKPEQRPKIRDILSGNLFINKATQSEVKDHMQHHLLMGGNEKVQRIKQIINQLRLKREQHNNLIQQMQQAEQRNIEREETIPEEERKRKKSHTIEGPFKYTTNKIINKQSFRIKQFSQKSLPLSSDPKIILAWIDYYLTKQIQQNNLTLLNFLAPEQDISFTLNMFNNTAKFAVSFQIKNNPVEAQLGEQEQEEEPELSSSFVSIYGEFYKFADDTRVCIEWSKGSDEEFCSQILLREMKNASLILSIYESEYGNL